MRKMYYNILAKYSKLIKLNLNHNADYGKMVEKYNNRLVYTVIEKKGYTLYIKF